MFIKKLVIILLDTLYLTNNLINIYNKNFEYISGINEKTISIRVSVFLIIFTITTRLAWAIKNGQDSIKTAVVKAANKKLRQH